MTGGLLGTSMQNRLVQMIISADKPVDSLDHQLREAMLEFSPLDHLDHQEMILTVMIQDDQDPIKTKGKVTTIQVVKTHNLQVVEVVDHQEALLVLLTVMDHQIVVLTLILTEPIQMMNQKIQYHIRVNSNDQKLLGAGFNPPFLDKLDSPLPLEIHSMKRSDLSIILLL
ncbi:hypothetical protein L218DRAFT_950871 [Marasmius fiardii PR-910]|nr:hypothetical protein L218DRAFT_950871 [Marasmius fiardii PR-910]